MNRVVEKRKIRSDKKRDIKPFVPIDLYDCIERLSYILRWPIKDVGELLCIEGLSSAFVLDCLSMYFVRNYSLSDTIYMAQSESTSRRIKIKGRKRRVSIRFKQPTYERINNLSHAMSLTIASTTSLLLIHAFRDTQLINRLISGSGTLDDNRVKERRHILKKSKKGNWQYESNRQGIF